MLFNEVDFVDRFEAAAKAGFKGVEYLFPYPYPKEQLSEKLAQHGLIQVLHNLPAGDWAKGERGIACLPDRVGEFQDGVGKAVDARRRRNRGLRLALRVDDRHARILRHLFGNSPYAVRRVPGHGRRRRPKIGLRKRNPYVSASARRVRFRADLARSGASERSDARFTCGTHGLFPRPM